MTTHQTRRPPATVRTLVVGARFLAGRDLDGRERTNARWGAAGTELVDARRAGWWAHQSYRRRAAIRGGLLVGMVLVIYGLLVDPASTSTSLRAAFWLALAAGVYVVVHKTRRWSHHQTYVVPTAIALADMLGVSRHLDPRTWVHVPVGHRSNPDKLVTINLPREYHARVTEQRRLADIAAKRLGMTSPDWDIDWEGEAPQLWLRAAPRPPEMVRFAAVREVFDQVPASDLVLGLGARNTPVTVSLESDSPHILASIGSGGGKSMFGKWAALQFLRRGGRVVIIDVVKRGASHKWAKDVPGVEMYRHPGPAHEALLELSETIEDRCESYWHRGNDGTDQRVLLIIEESNRTMRRLQSHWQNELDGKKTSPAVLAIEGILCVGREASVNGLTVGQRMSAQASGGGDSRENYGVRLGNRFSRQTARMLFGDCSPLPASSNHPGRVQVVTGGQAVEAQLPVLPDDDPEPIQWALEGAANSDQHPVRPAVTPVHDAGGARILTAVPNVTLVPLSDAAEHLGMELTALRNGRARDPEFPDAWKTQGQTKLYDLEALRRWAVNRPQAGGSAS